MTKTSLLAVIAFLIPFPAVSASDLALPAQPAEVRVPAAGPSAPDTIALIADYEDLYSALKFYSDIAFVSPQGSPQFLEASAAGRYLRARLEAVGRELDRRTGGTYRVGRRSRGEVSYRVSAELNEVFGFYGGTASREERGVPVKPGYCQINYVKNGVPFLVQYDGFLAKGEVILTFDDGPGPLTDEVAADMAAGKADSIFFVLGAKMGPNGKEIVKRTAAAGHELAVHGYHHATEAGKPLTALSTGEIVRQLGGVSASIQAAAGRKPTLFRPPYGIVTPEALSALYSGHGLIPVGWTVDTLDWSTKDPDELFAKTTELISKRGKGIVLMHDIHPQSRTAARRLVKWLVENGFRVVSPERLNKAYEGK